MQLIDPAVTAVEPLVVKRRHSALRICRAPLMRWRAPCPFAERSFDAGMATFDSVLSGLT